MARKLRVELRVEYPGAVYHLLNRGDRREPIFRDDQDRETYWTTDDRIRTPELVFEFGEPVTFNIVSVREYHRIGQRVEEFAVDRWQDGEWPTAPASATCASSAG